MSSVSTTTSLFTAPTATQASDDAQSCPPATVDLNSAGAPFISDSVLPDGHQAVPDQGSEGRKLAELQTAPSVVGTILNPVVSINQSSVNIERRYKGLSMVARGVGAIIVANEV
jgi:hypothetical protein